VPNVHPARYPATYLTALAGRAGWHQADLAACPIGPGTWDAALASSEVAATAADMVLAGERYAYALCRPPGHHAYADMAGGFCFLNNTAIAAQRLRAAHQRVAVLDVDVHHGNGTQGIFYKRADVLTISIHADPADYYPYFWGHAHNTGEGAGKGSNLNLPQPLGSPDVPWLAAGDQALARIAEFAPRRSLSRWASMPARAIRCRA
jgi:acetoin utilization deacetylase AcuC-like enzyme